MQDVFLSLIKTPGITPGAKYSVSLIISCLEEFSDADIGLLVVIGLKSCVEKNLLVGHLGIYIGVGNKLQVAVHSGIVIGVVDMAIKLKCVDARNRVGDVVAGRGDGNVSPIIVLTVILLNTEPFGDARIEKIVLVGGDLAVGHNYVGVGAVVLIKVYSLLEAVNLYRIHNGVKHIEKLVGLDKVEGPLINLTLYVINVEHLVALRVSLKQVEGLRILLAVINTVHKVAELVSHSGGVVISLTKVCDGEAAVDYVAYVRTLVNAPEEVAVGYETVKLVGE